MEAYPDFLRVALSHIRVNDKLVAHLAAVIVRGGKVVSVGRNRPGMNTYVMHNADHASCSSVHAEIDAIFRARKKTDLTGCKMYVARKTKHGQVGLAAPCDMCSRAIQRYSIKRVFYTIDDDTWAVLRIKRATDIPRRRHR